MVYSSHQLINRLVLNNNVAASTIQPKHVLFAIIRSVFYAINQNRFIEFHETRNKNDDTNIITHTPTHTHTRTLYMNFNKIVFYCQFPLKYVTITLQLKLQCQCMYK